MIKRILLLCLIAISCVTYGQVQKIPLKSNSTVSGSVKVYDIHTGEEIPQDTIRKLAEKNPRFGFEFEYDKYGQISKMLLDMNNPHERVKKSFTEDHKIPEGEQFPPFAFRTTDQLLLDSEDFNGSWILLQFHIFPERVDQEKLVHLENEINDFNKTDDIIGIICFGGPSGNIKGKMSDNSPLHIVENGRNFHIKYKIRRSPTTIIIDPTGKVHQYIDPLDTIQLDQLK